MNNSLPIIELKEDINKKRLDVFTSYIDSMTDSRPYDLDQVQKQSIRFVITSSQGVYLLLKKESVVYVGQSINPESRILEHARLGKDFDSFFIARCDCNHLDDLEALLILCYQPLLNEGLQNRSKIIRSTGQVVSWLKKHGLSKYDLNRWESKRLISSIASFGNFNYYLAKDVAALIEQSTR